MRTSTLLATAAITLAATQAAQAATVAYLRFEEGPDGAQLLGEAGAPTTSLAIDSAGGDDNFRTYNSPATETTNFNTSPTYTTFVPSATVPGTGAENNFSFAFDGDDDIYQNTPDTSPISTTFDDGNQFTIEAFVYPTVTNVFDTFVGRDDYDDQGGNGDEALFYLQQRGDTGQYAAIAVPEAGGESVRIDGPAVVANQWVHLAVVGDGTNMMFYVDGELAGSAPLAGGLYNPANTATWTIGRGFFANNVVDFMEGNVDEVRFSDTALSPSQFLNTPIPEPTTLALLPVAGLLALRRRR